MARTRSVIVVANQTATAPELIEALSRLAGSEPTRFTLIVPGTPHDDASVPPEQRLQEALAELRSHGLEIDGHVGCYDPVIAAGDEWSRGVHNQVVVSTRTAERVKMASGWIARPRRAGHRSAGHSRSRCCRPRPEIIAAWP